MLTRDRDDGCLVKQEQKLQPALQWTNESESESAGKRSRQRFYGFLLDSDGINSIDGTEDAAGAIVTPDTLVRARAANLDPRACLAAHDSYSFFSGIGDLVRTGPTGTNVNDIRAILITRGGRQAE